MWFVWFLIIFAVWFAIAWLPQFVKAWIIRIIYNRDKRNHDKDDDWVYKI